MKLPRRQFLHLAAGAAALPAALRIAWAQTYPSRPVRIVVGFPAGGAADIPARLIGQWLSERLGQAFIIENRPGTAGNLAAEAVVKAAPDGHTLLFAISANAFNGALYDNLSFNFIRDIAPVAGVARQPIMMVVNPSVPAKTVPEFIAYAKVNSGKLNLASNGIGTPQQLAGELFMMLTGTKLLYVPYRGDTPAITALLSGEVQVYFCSVPVAIEHIRAAKLRALAVTTAMRSEALPQIPLMSDFLPGFEASPFNGIGAPSNTPIEIIQKLNNEINSALADPKMRTRLADLGSSVLSGSPADFGKLLADEEEKWGKVRAANIKPE